jgi:hypothetical protein
MPSRHTWWTDYGRAVRWTLAGLAFPALILGVQLAADRAAGLANLAHVGVALGILAATLGPLVWFYNQRDRAAPGYMFRDPNADEWCPGCRRQHPRRGRASA